ncbi:MAG: hypothetical protein C0403_15370 [Desulfobacterium sp.]|nr:hypothetical protein [Desulfobacterium sp.]
MSPLHRLFGKKEKSLNNTCYSESEFRKKLKIERSRTHRNSHEFSLIVLRLKPLQLNDKTKEKMIQNIHSRIRDIDHIGWYDKNNIGIILPYTSTAGVEGFVRSILQSITDLKQDIKYLSYKYPPDKKSITENAVENIFQNT